jgi:flagellar assembly protein FliH
LIPSTTAAQPAALRPPRRLARAGTVTTAAFRSVDELEAATSDEDFSSRLGDTDRSRLEDLARQGYLDGHGQGAREGYQAGMEQAVREVTDRLGSALRALSAAAGQLAAADAVALAELDGQIVGFALDVARTIVGHELAAGADPGAAAITRAIALAPDRGDIVARLSPTDVAALGDVDGLAPGRAVTVVADPGVQPGGCVLDIGACRVDAQIDTVLARVAKVLAA